MPFASRPQQAVLRLQVPAVRQAAEASGRALMAGLCPHAVPLVMPTLLAGMEGKRNWQTKRGALMLLAALTRCASDSVAACIPDVVPVVMECMCDARSEVKVRAAGRGVA
jgi:elongation factor 3